MFENELWYKSQEAISKRLGELQQQLVRDAEMVVNDVFGAEGALDSDVAQIKQLAQDRKDLLLIEEKLAESASTNTD